MKEEDLVKLGGGGQGLISSTGGQSTCADFGGRNKRKKLGVWGLWGCGSKAGQEGGYSRTAGGTIHDQ